MLKRRLEMAEVVENGGSRADAREIIESEVLRVWYWKRYTQGRCLKEEG